VTVGGKADVLGELKTIKQFQEVYCSFGIWIIDMDIEVTQQKN